MLICVVNITETRMGDISNIKGVDHFLHLLFTAGKLQVRALLETLDIKQIRAVREIIFNTLDGAVPLTEAQEAIINKRKKVLQRILRKKGYKSGDLIARHHRIVYQTLCLVKDHILTLV